MVDNETIDWLRKDQYKKVESLLKDQLGFRTAAQRVK
jgi:hypothetical protein